MRVQASSFNPIDAKRTSRIMRQIFPTDFPFVPNRDFSGVIDSIEEGVLDRRPGDQVFGYSVAGGAYAEFIAIAADKIALKRLSKTLLAKVDASLSFANASGET